MKQHNTKELQELSANDLSAALRMWSHAQRTATTPFSLHRALRMIDRIRREHERRGL